MGLIEQMYALADAQQKGLNQPYDQMMQTSNQMGGIEYLSKLVKSVTKSSDPMGKTTEKIDFHSPSESMINPQIGQASPSWDENNPYAWMHKDTASLKGELPPNPLANPLKTVAASGSMSNWMPQGGIAEAATPPVQGTPMTPGYTAIPDQTKKVGPGSQRPSIPNQTREASSGEDEEKGNWMSDLGTILLATSAGIQGKDVGGVLKSLLEAEGKSPIQPKEFLEIQKDIAIKQMDMLKTASANGTLTAKDLFTEYEKVGKNFDVIKDAYGRVENSVKDPSPAGDLSMLYGYIKMLDPTSAVKEGELATASNTGSVPTKVWRQYNEVLNGKKLQGGVREDFFKRAQMLYKGSETQFSKSSKEFQKLAQENGVNPRSFMRDFGYVSSTEQGKEQKTSSGMNKTKSGNTYRKVQ